VFRRRREADREQSGWRSDLSTLSTLITQLRKERLL
jgi:hypothetical protein